MVTPKQSAEILGWTIESALNLLVDLLNSNQTIRQNDLFKTFKDFLINSNIPSNRISRINYQLKKNKYLKFDQNNSVVLTDKAKIKIIEKYVSIQKHDNRKRLVSFDIPETKRRERNGFRKAIKKMGFRQIQKSLWVCDRDIGDLVDITAKEFKVEKYVAYFVIENSNIEKFINKILRNGK